MKVNWKIRCKSAAFWAGIASAIVVFIYNLLGLIGITPAVDQSEVMQLITMILSVLTALGVVVDPTTKGLSDSDRAMTYGKMDGETSAMGAGSEEGADNE